MNEETNAQEVNTQGASQEEVKEQPSVVEQKVEPVVEEVKDQAPSPAPKVEDRGNYKGGNNNKGNNKPQFVQQSKAVVKEVATPVVNDFEGLVSKMRVNGTPSEVQLVTSLDSYIEAMKPGRPIEGTAGVTQQYKLWTTLYRVIEESSTQEFNKLWNVVVAYFREYQKGVFNGQYVNRFAEFWARGEDELYAFQQLTNLLSLAATDRQNLPKLVSIHKVVEKKFSEVGRGRLINMYS